MHASDIHGHVLEVADDMYTRRFGGERVTKSDVLHVADRGPKVTIIADLSRDENIPSNTFDCIILTQTLHLIYDVPAVLRNVHRILKPGGVLLVTLPGISRISREDMNRWGDYWRFTSLSARRLFEDAFRASNVTLQTYGNVLTAASFLYGLAAQELRQDELDFHDPNYEVTIAVRAVKT